MHFIDSINLEYTTFGIADNSLLLNNNRNMCKSGAALWWRRSMSRCISPQDIVSERICVMQLTLGNSRLYIIQVYAHILPSF